MSVNQMFVRNLVGVATTIAAITTIALWWGGPSRETAGSTYRPAPRAATPQRSPAELGARLYETKGCVACHTTDGQTRVGPSFAGSWGSEVALATGITLRFDEAYVRESLSRPHAKARPGYPASMPSYDGLLTPKEIDALIAFLSSL